VKKNGKFFAQIDQSNLIGEKESSLWFQICVSLCMHWYWSVFSKGFQWWCAI